MKLKIDELEFNSDYFYLQTNSIVEKTTFNNRTFYSKLKKYPMPIDPTLLQQHHQAEISLSIPLIENESVNYIVIEYREEDWNAFYSLLKHLLKSLNIEHFQAYKNEKKNLFQLFIPQKSIALNLAYKKVENIKHLLDFKSKKSYKIYPNKNLPINFNIINLPNEKV